MTTDQKVNLALGLAVLAIALVFWHHHGAGSVQLGAS